MVQWIAVIHWYDWVLNNVLNRLYRCVRLVGRTVVLLAASRVPAYTPVSSVPVPDADALDTGHTRVCLRYARVGRCVYVRCGGTPMGDCVGASA